MEFSVLPYAINFFSPAILNTTVCLHFAQMRIMFFFFFKKNSGGGILEMGCITSICKQIICRQKGP